MKKILLFTTAVLLLLANTAMADSVAGKFGITARGGASYILNSEWSDFELASVPTLSKDIKPDIGWAGGGGFMYGITDNLAVNFDVTYFQAKLKGSDSDVGDFTVGTGKTVDFALGAQWRFIPKSRFVPYVGAGFDIMLNYLDQEFAPSFVTADVATTYGCHLSAGADFFFTPRIALNAEIRGLYSTEGNVTIKAPIGEITIAKYNPSNISGFIGIRFFFP
jgi:outer membrane protein